MSATSHSSSGHAWILSTGRFLPEKVLSNKDLEQMVETSDEWIITRTGIRERRIAAADEFTSSMGVKAAQRALARVSLDPMDIDLILVATLTPDYVFPNTACLIQKELGAWNAAALDLQAACSGFLYALAMAQSLIVSGMYRNILVIASEKLSAITDYQDRTTCILFGDGAGACIVSREPHGFRIDKVCLGADGCQADLLIMPAGGGKEPASRETVENRKHFIKMKGNELFKHAVRRMEFSLKECLEACQLKEEEVGWVIPHQANSRIIDAIAKRFSHLPPDRIFRTVEKYGNTSASSVIIALDELVETGRVKQNDPIILTAFGGGLTWGSAVLTYEAS
jgi:3-oxoacyl-[acyl-carrier-protein] synthase-3